MTTQRHIPTRYELPSIDVITVVYRNPDLRKAVASLEEQKHQHHRLILIDGSCSTLFSQDVSAYLPADSIHVTEKDHGIYDAVNKGFHRASAPIVGLLHSDDVYASEDVLSQVARCFSETGADAVYGDLEYVHNGRTIRYWKAGGIRKAKLRAGWMPPHPTVFLRREVAERVGPYDTRFRIAGDYEYLLRLILEHDFKIVYLPKVITKMKIGGASNGSVKRLLRKSIEDVWAMRRHGINPYIALPLKVLSKLPQFLGGHRLFSGLIRIR